MTTMDIARNALKGVSKGTPVKDAAEIVRRAVAARNPGVKYYITQRADKPNTWWVGRPGNGSYLEVGEDRSGFSKNGLWVSLYQGY